MFNDETTSAILASYLEGYPFEAACLAAGVSDLVVHRWLLRGKADRESALTTPYEKFYDDMKKAKAIVLARLQARHG